VKTAAVNVQGLDQKIAGLVGVMPDLLNPPAAAAP
jgi:DNA-binding transcriptional regulator YdaS (Cro superfamily)